jgi:trigger factor
MQVTVEKLSPVLVEFQVTVPADRVKTTMDRAFSDLARNAHVKGFRKGKAPKQVLAHLFGDRVAADVATQLVEDTLPSVLDEKKIRPISQPVIDKSKVSASEDFAYRARFEVTPDIEKVIYEGLELKRPVYPVDDKMVDSEVEALRQRKSTLEPLAAARPAQKGDTALIDFDLEVEGKIIAEAAGQDVNAELGSDSLLPALSEGLIGKEIGSHTDISVSFPENHSHEMFRGKSAIFHVNLKDIKERKLPALDDEFAKDLGKFETLDALKADIKERLEHAMKDRSENELAEAMVAELCNKNPVPVPPSLVQQQARMQENEIVQQARRSGQNIKNLSAELRQRVAVDAEMKVRAGLLMAEIAKSQKIQVVDEDVQKAYAELAEQTGKNINKVKAQYQDAKQRELLIGMILEDKVLNIIEAASKITDHVVTAEEK